MNKKIIKIWQEPPGQQHEVKNKPQEEEFHSYLENIKNQALIFTKRNIKRIREIGSLFPNSKQIQENVIKFLEQMEEESQKLQEFQNVDFESGKQAEELIKKINTQVHEIKLTFQQQFFPYQALFQKLERTWKIDELEIGDFIVNQQGQIEEGETNIKVDFFQVRENIYSILINENKIYLGGFKIVKEWIMRFQHFQEVSSLEKHEGNVIGISLINHHLVTCSDDNQVIIWQNHQNQFWLYEHLLVNTRLAILSQLINQTLILQNGPNTLQFGCIEDGKSIIHSTQILKNFIIQKVVVNCDSNFVISADSQAVQIFSRNQKKWQVYQKIQQDNNIQKITFAFSESFIMSLEKVGYYVYVKQTHKFLISQIIKEFDSFLINTKIELYFQFIVDKSILFDYVQGKIIVYKMQGGQMEIQKIIDIQQYMKFQDINQLKVFSWSKITNSILAIC